MAEMIYEAVFNGAVDDDISRHLLSHFHKGEMQEDLCFGLWRPSTGRTRYTGVIYKAIFPEKGDRKLCGNVEFNPAFLSRALNFAIKENAGLAFMHSHPSDGWQGMSAPDVIAERDVLAYPAQATKLPLLGLTIGTDGYWSARFWKKDGSKMCHHWCQKVRSVGQCAYKIYCNDALLPPSRKKNILKRTHDTLGTKCQNNIARMKVGVVGLGSVGCIVAEALARIGVGNVVLIDHDKVKEHNLDRLLYGTPAVIGKKKVYVASDAMKDHATASKINITALACSIHEKRAYQTALDCDFLFSCVDRPVARDVLNFIAYAHCIPVIDGGVNVQKDFNKSGAHWRAHLITPFHQCMRCNRQYTTSDVPMELDGSLDNPSYVRNIPQKMRQGNENVFPFSASVASMEINMMLRYLIIAPEWWPEVQQQDYGFMNGQIRINNEKCLPQCEFRARIARGDECAPYYLVSAEATDTPLPPPQAAVRWLKNITAKIFGIQF